jgi:signal peptidase I
VTAQDDAIDDVHSGEILPSAAVREDTDSVSKRRWHSAVSWGITIVFALVLTVVVQTWFYKVYSIPSASMVPTLLVNDRVVVSKLNKDPSRGDIIVFNRPKDDPAAAGQPSVLIKRVIGLSGETVTFVNGAVEINGKKLQENYLPKGTATRGADGTKPIHVPKGDLLVLGDNRGISQDGRYFGPIPKSLIVGRAVLRIWPPSRVGRL